MQNTNFNQLVSFIFGIANDCLVDAYDVGDYRKVILPMIVIRRFDAVLEPTKAAVLAMKEKLDAAGLIEQDEALCQAAGQAFCNKSKFMLRDLKARTSRQQLKLDFIEYLDGFSKNVQDIIDKFGFRAQIDKLTQHDALGILIAKFVDPTINLSAEPVLNADGSVRLPALDNHAMGTVFEEVIRKFNEETNVTDAGRHFTPRDIVQLMADIAFLPVQEQLKSTTYRIYDGACGTGGMLSVSADRIGELARAAGKKVSIKLYGQENAEETYAIARADMLVKGEGTQADNIYFGSTISNDGFAGETFDFMLSNPPFGTAWKTDLKAWGDIDKKDITDPRFVVKYNKEILSLVPDIGDPQMLFLANNISKMKTNTPLGSRIVEVHNGSSLFTGKAGQGPSNLRQYIIEQDLLEAIVALPEKMFYNTGIGTYLWVLANKKSPERRGKVQLIDATALKTAMRKNLGEKNCMMTEEIRRQVLDIYMAFDKADPEYSKVFDNSEFGYWLVEVNRPLRLSARLTKENIEEVVKKLKDTKIGDVLNAMMTKKSEYLNYSEFIQSLSKNVKLTAAKQKQLRNIVGVVNENAKAMDEADPDLKDTEQIPFNYPGGIEGFIEKEVRPYAPDVWIDEDSIKTGYELSFTRYFYKPAELRSLKEISKDLRAIERETDGLLDEILGG